MRAALQLEVSPTRIPMMNHLERSRHNLFSSIDVDRAARTRGNGDELTALADSDHARFLPVFQYKVLTMCDTNQCTTVALKKHELVHHFEYTTLPVYLGRRDDLHYFAVAVEEKVKKIGEFTDLRHVAALLSDEDAALCGYAQAILTWQNTHRHCGVCSAPTVAQQGGHILQCSDLACAREHYPRTDPAIIVLVEHGERALLGRKAGWPARRYSTIAGFVEPGESAEQAVVREVDEETGVEVIELRYHSSQPWPFPGSLMLGYRAQAGRHKIQLNDQELEEAIWLSRQELMDRMAHGNFLPPTKISISFRLIEDWFNSNSEVPFKVWCENNKKLR